jgi:hypothetical protein
VASARSDGSKGGYLTLQATRRGESPMSIPRLICTLLLLASISCQPSDKSGERSSPSHSQNEAKRGAITVTVDGREGSPEDVQAFGAWGKKVLSDAVHKAINDRCKEAVKKLDITDPLEVALLSVSFKPGTWTGDELWSVYLVRPGNETKAPRTIVLLREGRPIVRFTRATAPVERPIAVMSAIGIKDGRLAQVELFLIYGSDEKWKPYRPSERTESLKDGKE